MYTFVAGAGLGQESLRRGLAVPSLLRSAASAVVEQLPDVGAALDVAVLSLPEIEGGWATIRPRSAPAFDLISESSDADLACLVFGEYHGGGSASRAIIEAWQRGGPEAVGRVTGVFSALLCERRERLLHVFTSTPGCRSLHYVSAPPLLALSPLDVGLVALSGSDVRLDLTGVAALAAAGWPIGGGGALAGVLEAQPYERLAWSARGLQTFAVNPLSGNGRLTVADRGQLGSKIEEVIDELRDGVRQQVARLYAGGDIIRVPLTAGVDSRAVLSLLLSLVPRERLETYTRGTSSEDVRVARRLAAGFGLRHVAEPVAPSSASTFLDNARLLAIATNGVANADAAWGRRMAVARSAPAPVGVGGEVFRGFYYNYLRRRPVPARSPADVASALLTAPLRKLSALVFADGELQVKLRQRLTGALERFASISPEPFDLADLFYIFERMGRWGATGWRRALGPSFVPFASGAAMRRMFELPSPIGDHAIVPTIIDRLGSRRAYLTPVNGANLLYLEGPGRVRHVSREVLRLGAKLVRTARQRARAGERTPRQQRHVELYSSLQPLLRDKLLDPRSVARDLFTSRELERVVDSHFGSQHAAIGGALLSVELLRQSLEQARARAERER